MVNLIDYWYSKMPKISLMQFNPTLGDLTNNCQKIKALYQEQARKGVDLVVFPEFSICGYPPEDLVVRPSFYKAIWEKVKELANSISTAGIVIGAPVMEAGKLYNAAIFIHKKEVKQVIKKQHLANDGVFDEERVFKSAEPQKPIEFMGRKIGVIICEDGWYNDVALFHAKEGAELIISINASPFEKGKLQKRAHIASNIATGTKLPIAYLNAFGAQDELVFDGHSFILDKNNEQVAMLGGWQEGYISFALGNKSDINISSVSVSEENSATEIANMYQATMLGLRDYLYKNGFEKVVLGLSGGIDSALVATIAADSLGPENVHCLGLSTHFTSKASVGDATILANNLQCELDFLPIEVLFSNFIGTLNPLFSKYGATKEDTTEENIQARVRGTLLMAVSNKLGKLLLATGNKSELAVGYCTLYGDMCGAYAPIKDLYKTEVYELARWRNENIPQSSKLEKLNLIPQSILTKAPSAELRYNQTDQDFLPPYEILDKILYSLIEEDRSIEESAVLAGCDLDTVKKVASLLYKSEFKRRQAPIGTKVSPRILGKERRYPITNRFIG